MFILKSKRIGQKIRRNKMSRKILTDAEVEREIEKLQDSPFVQLARKELRLKYKQRQKLYNLRNLEKRGKELAAAFIEFLIKFNILQTVCMNIRTKTVDCKV